MGPEDYKKTIIEATEVLINTIEGLKDEVSGLESQVDEQGEELEKAYIIPKDLDNIITEPAISGLFKNLQYIPMKEIELLTEKYGKK